MDALRGTYTLQGTVHTGGWSALVTLTSPCSFPLWRARIHIRQAGALASTTETYLPHGRAVQPRRLVWGHVLFACVVVRHPLSVRVCSAGHRPIYLSNVKDGAQYSRNRQAVSSKPRRVRIHQSLPGCCPDSYHPRRVLLEGAFRCCDKTVAGMIAFVVSSIRSLGMHSCIGKCSMQHAANAKANSS